MARNYRLLSQIRLDDENSWDESVFITIDVDWAVDGVIEDTASILEQGGVSATWFFTHKSRLIDQLVSAGHEVGIHPNFNPLLTGEATRTAQQILEDCMSWCPNATSVRSHSLVSGAPISELMRELGISITSNVNIPSTANMVVRPWLTSATLIEAPYSWADEHSWNGSHQSHPEAWLTNQGLLVADFHPIHIFLNTNSSDLYERTRFIHRDSAALARERFVGLGVRSFFKQMCGVDNCE